MTHLNEALVLVGGAVLSFGLVSRFVRKHALSEVLAALLLGVLIGPSALNVLNLHRWGIQSLIVEEVARLTLAVGLMSSALRLSRTVLSRHWRSLSLLLTLVMIMTWVIPLDRLLLLPVFMVLGTVLPWHAWDRLGWRAPVLVLAVLVLRRLPVVVLLRRSLPPLHGLVDAAFVGWFGPIGVGALFYVAFALRITGLQQVWTIATLLIAGSVVVHAVTATPLTRWYGAYRHRTEQAPARGRDVTA